MISTLDPALKAVMSFGDHGFEPKCARGPRKTSSPAFTIRRARERGSPSPQSTERASERRASYGGNSLAIIDGLLVEGRQINLRELRVCDV